MMIGRRRYRIARYSDWSDDSEQSVCLWLSSRSSKIEAPDTKSGTHETLKQIACFVETICLKPSGPGLISGSKLTGQGHME